MPCSSKRRDRKRVHNIILPGSRVRMHFVLRLQDGTVVDETQPDAPIEFTMGDGTLVAGLERALYTLKPGVRQTIQISPEEGFGVRDPAHVYALPRADFPSDIPLEPGVLVAFSMPEGEQVPGTILKLDDNEVVVDFNHPLAGRDVVFEVEVLDVVTNVANEG